MIDCKLAHAPATAEGIDLVRPELHHLGALGQTLVAVVDRGNRCIDMLKLEFNRLLGEARQVCAIDRDPLSIQQGRGARPEAGWAMRTAVARATAACIGNERGQTFCPSTKGRTLREGDVPLEEHVTFIKSI